MCEYVRENFYVDDTLVSRDNAKDFVTLIKRTQNRLTQGGNIRLHNILSNSTDVVSSFAQKDLAEGIADIDFDWHYSLKALQPPLTDIIYLRNRLLDQGYSKIRLIRSLKKFIFRYQDLVEIYSVSAEKIINDGFSYSENV